MDYWKLLFGRLWDGLLSIYKEIFALVGVPVVAIAVIYGFEDNGKKFMAIAGLGILAVIALFRLVTIPPVMWKEQASELQQAKKEIARLENALEDAKKGDGDDAAELRSAVTDLLSSAREYAGRKQGGASEKDVVHYLRQYSRIRDRCQRLADRILNNPDLNDAVMDAMNRCDIVVDDAQSEGRVVRGSLGEAQKYVRILQDKIDDETAPIMLKDGGTIDGGNF